MGSLYYVGILCIVLGMAGFTKKGLPFSSNKRISGRSAQLIGTLCIAFGLLLAFTAVWFANPAARNNFLWLSCGIAIGWLSSWLVAIGRWP
jgi:hypothetical protein